MRTEDLINAVIDKINGVILSLNCNTVEFDALDKSV